MLDQVTKRWAAAGLDSPLVLVPGMLRFELSHNTGAMFSMFARWPDPWRWLLLTAFPLLAIVAIVYLLWKTERREVFARLGLALILGGALGNVVDRLLHGHVIDFIDVYASWEPLSSQLISWFGTNRWPTFNVADMGLTVGAALLIWELVFRRRARQESKVVPVSR